MSDERELRKRLERAALPDEQGAEERAWRVVRAARAERRDAQPRRRWPRVAAVLGVSAAVLVLALTPAGAKVADWIEDVVEPGRDDAAPFLRSIPGGGEILVESRGGVWVVHSDGSKRLLGSYSDAGWSPRGLFVAVADERALVATEPDGDVHWSVSGPGRVFDPVWSPSGFRIAYRRGNALHVVRGDGIEDRVLAEGVLPLATAWRPGEPGTAPHVLAYVDGKGRTLVRDADTGELLLGPARGSTASVALDWSADGRHLVVASPSRIRILAETGRPVRLDDPIAKRHRVVDMQASPARSQFVAVTRAHEAGGVRSEVVVFRLDPGSERQVAFSGPGRIESATWSPDGRRLLLEWSDADQWLFLPVDRSGSSRPSAVGQIGELFDPGAVGEPAFPRVAGWCCP